MQIKGLKIDARRRELEERDLDCLEQNSVLVEILWQGLQDSGEYPIILKFKISGDELLKNVKNELKESSRNTQQKLTESSGNMGERLMKCQKSGQKLINSEEKVKRSRIMERKLRILVCYRFQLARLELTGSLGLKKFYDDIIECVIIQKSQRAKIRKMATNTPQDLMQGDSISQGYANSSEGNYQSITRDDSEYFVDDTENTSSDEETRQSNISVTVGLESSEFNNEDGLSTEVGEASEKAILTPVVSSENLQLHYNSPASQYNESSSDDDDVSRKKKSKHVSGLQRMCGPKRSWTLEEKKQHLNILIIKQASINS
ncbi:hypothetical protein FQA39_LY17859 [Lamprigera yunnana]|nr:hypothetical protein FQA39_LY17859 [Lamprigera yunnana]